jgi:hypothetical protein
VEPATLADPRQFDFAGLTALAAPTGAAPTGPAATGEAPAGAPPVVAACMSDAEEQACLHAVELG